MKTTMELKDHYHFLLDEVQKVEREVKKIVNSSLRQNIRKSRDIVRVKYAANLRLETYFHKRRLELQAQIESESIIDVVEL